MISYNLILHAGFFPVNAIIIWKELQLEFFTMIDRRRGDNSDFALGIFDFFNVFIQYPFNWIVWAFNNPDKIFSAPNSFQAFIQPKVKIQQ